MKLHPILRWLLWPLSLVYGAAVVARAWLYRIGLLKQKRLSGVVISVGNLTVGGTGKTPMVLWLAEKLYREGKKVGVLTRGYRGRRRWQSHGVSGLPSDSFRIRRKAPLVIASDEVFLLERRIGHFVRLGVGVDRWLWGRELERLGVEWFVMDDGFQHLQLARDIDITLIDASDRAGSRSLLPTGRLREPLSALQRADIVVITRTKHAPALQSVIERYTAAPIFYACVTLKGVFQAQQNVTGPVKADWRNRRYFAFCGIGNPQAFLDDLRLWGVNLVGVQAYPDHHHYSSDDIRQIQKKALALSAERLICTEKDLFNFWPLDFAELPVFYARIELCMPREDEFVRELLSVAERKLASRKQ